MELVMPGRRRRACDSGIHAVGSGRGERLLAWIAGSGPAMTKEGEKEQAGWGGAAPSAGGLARDTGTCSSARTCARRCSIRTLARAPSAFATPAGGTRRPSAPPGTSLRTLPHLDSRSCFVLNGIGPRVKAGGPKQVPGSTATSLFTIRAPPFAKVVNIR